MCRVLVASASIAVGLTPAPTHAQDSASRTNQPEEGRTATIILHDGQVITGTLVEESDEAVTLTINGIRTTIETRKIRESYIQPPIEERYKATRASIDDDDAESLIQLAKWLMDKGRYDLALIELDGVLEHEPFNDAARSLRAATFGFVTLELAGGFGLAEDPDYSYRYLVETLDAGLRAQAARG